LSCLGLSPAAARLRDCYNLDDDLSPAFTHDGITGRPGHNGRWSCPLLLRGKTSSSLRLNKASFSKIIAKIALSILAGALPLHAQQNPEIAPRALPIVAGPNEIARFLAGMPVPENSPLAPLTHDPAWQQHSAFFEKEFSKLNLRELEKLHAWEETYFPEATQPIPVAFYMFSGPDLLYVDQFFPKASVYVLCGKESMGPPPDPL